MIFTHVCALWIRILDDLSKMEQAEARHQRAVNKSLQEEIDMLYGKQP